MLTKVSNIWVDAECVCGVMPDREDDSKCLLLMSNGKILKCDAEANVAAEILGQYD